MKPQLAKKYFPFIVSLVSVTLFSVIVQSVNAQYVEGPPHPGYICRCTIPGYGCGGSAGCLSRCSLACHRSSLTDISPDSISESTDAPLFITEPETQKKIHQLEWKTWNEDEGIGDVRSYILQSDIGNKAETKKLSNIN